MDCYSPAELRRLGLAAGEGSRIDRSVRLFSPQQIVVGSGVRIDCFAVITAGPDKVRIGDHVHLAAGVYLFGTAGIEIGDFASLSARVAVYSTNDDYVGGALVGPTVPEGLREVERGKVTIGRHVVVGCGSVILPGVALADGAAVGALSLVKEDVASGHVVAGVPARVRKRRDIERLRELERRMGLGDGAPKG